MIHGLTNVYTVETACSDIVNGIATQYISQFNINKVDLIAFNLSLPKNPFGIV